VIRRALAIAVKEFLHLRRDWRTLLSLVGMPMLLLLIYGYALSFDVRHIRLAVVDLDGTRAARELRDAFLASGYFDLVATAADQRALPPLFDTGRAQAALVVPTGFAAALAAGRSTSVQFLLDGSDSRTATTVLAYAAQIVAARSPRIAAASVVAPVVPRTVVWYNPDLASSRFLVPGLLAFILMVTSVVATALAVVREKERGTMESLRASPLRAVELLLGKTAPYLAVGAAAASGSLALAWALFGVPIRGSLLHLAGVTLLFLIGGLAWGVLISTLAESQQVAFQMGLLTSMLPTLLLSGFIFPISSMPRVIQLVTHIVPARYFLAALRAIVLKGAGADVWWPQAAALVVFGAVALTLATVRAIRSL